ncbi:MAG: esterase/lipase family protein [Vicinamibacterales bacterium]
MSQTVTADPARFLSHLEASAREENLFRDLYQVTGEEERSVAGLRRRRRRAANSLESAMKSVSLVEENGTLYWRDGVPARPSSRRRRGRRGRDAARDGSLVLTREFPTLAPNKIIAAIGAIDRRLNNAIGDELQSRLRRLRQTPDGGFELQEKDVVGPFSGRTLLFVHGTFSNATNMLKEFTIPGRRGLPFLNRATQGSKKYDRVLFFDHPTLSVSPVINALELGRALAGSSGQIDVVAHSRGGLVVRWWLEAFGSSLSSTPKAQVRAVLAGSPLHGTSLAAPDKIQHAMSLISNLGTFAEKTLSLVGLSNPFIWVAGKLVEVIVSVTGALAKTPLVDALTALVPGLSGQSAVDNNHEINRLRIGPVAVDPEYYAILSNFETQNPGWRFWRNFRKDRAADLATDIVFPGDNDLVVDTWSMTDFGVPKLKLAGDSCDFRTSDTVWHGNYFRQDKSVKYIATQFGLAMD